MQTSRFLTAFWALAKPYWVSEQRAKGLALLAAVIGLALALVWINVQLNAWNNDFYNAIQEKKIDDFYRLLGTFTLLVFAYIGIAVYRFYLQQMLQIEWRTWLNERFLAEDRKSTRLNSSHLVISYAVFCLKKKKTTQTAQRSWSSHSACGLL